MNKLIIEFDDKRITSLECNNGEATSGDLISASLETVRILCLSYIKQKNDDESRKYIYNGLVLYFSDLVNEIYPENQDIKGSPEEFLELLDKKIKELKELEANVQPSANKESNTAETKSLR